MELAILQAVIKRHFLTITFALAVGFSSFAQEAEPALAFGYGMELALYSRDSIAAGAALSFDYKLPWLCAVGARTAIYGDKYGDGTLEAAGLFRRYFFSETHSGLFAQADLGLAYIIIHEGENHPRLLAGLRGGYRLPFKQRFYAEAYARLGYPISFGAGIVVGYRK